MTSSLKQLSRGIWRLGSAELLARLCYVAIVILLGHRYGVVIVGLYALAMTVSYYLQPVIDFGLRHVGARLMAQYPLSANEIMRRIQRRRVSMAAAVLPLTLLYAFLAKLPPDMKLWLFLFSATAALYALSLDWAAWGREQLQVVGLMRALVPFCILLAVIAAPADASQVLWWIFGGNAAGYLLQAAISRAWWTWHQRGGSGASTERHEIAEALALRHTSIMGFSIIGTLAFNSIDMLMLGVMSNPKQIGLYGAAYRVLNQVLVTFYLLTSVLYPQLARQAIGDRIRMLRPRILLSLLGAGVAIAALVAVSRRPVMTILFGHQFLMACPLLLLLAWAIPLDFLTSYLSNAYIAWGMEKKILLCTAVAAGSNIVLNLVSIPSYGATAAAVNTLICYAILLTGLAVAGRSVKETVQRAEPEPQLTA